MSELVGRKRRDDGGSAEGDGDWVKRAKRERGADRLERGRQSNSSHGDEEDRRPDSQRYGKREEEEEEVAPKADIKPDFGLSGALAAETNTYKGVQIKHLNGLQYSQPPNAKKPKKKWRLYPFKGDTALDTIDVFNQSAFLIGRMRGIVDIPVDHPSCSKQHAVIQFRERPLLDADGIKVPGRMVVKPYIIDLESTNGTHLNGERLESSRFYELLPRDSIKFGFSSRDYVILCEDLVATPPTPDRS